MRLLKRPEVQSKTGLSKSAIYMRMAIGTFPRPVVLSRKAVAWVESEIEAWIADQIAGRDSGDKVKPKKDAKNATHEAA